MDQFNTLGLGENVPVATGNANDAMLALVDGKFVILRVPYPMGFFAKGLDGRIDDPKAGWKGRGYGRLSEAECRSTWRPAKGQNPKSSSGSSVRIRWRSEKIASFGGSIDNLKAAKKNQSNFTSTTTKSSDARPFWRTGFTSSGLVTLKPLAPNSSARRGRSGTKSSVPITRPL